MMTIKDIMTEYKVGRKTATRWAKEVGTAPRVKGGIIYVSRKSLERYLQG